MFQQMCGGPVRARGADGGSDRAVKGWRVALATGGIGEEFQWPGVGGVAESSTACVRLTGSPVLGGWRRFQAA